MGLERRYHPKKAEPRLQAFWQEAGIYQFHMEGDGTVFAIDTPPPTVSGELHLGHVYSYSHTDFMARYWRMQGFRVFYPIGYDDNGLPTERLVERTLDITAEKIGRTAFREECLQFSERVELDYQTLLSRLGFSIDWRYAYRTIDASAQKIAQWSFLDLYRKGLVYRQEAPVIWCPECRTAIAQADVDDLERVGEFYTLEFHLADGEALAIATTRPELLPACVAVFVHPEDVRYRDLVGQSVTVPLFGQSVPVLADTAVNPEKGTGAVMCCTFGDQTDVAWWYTHQLPLREAVGLDGRLTEVASPFTGLPIPDARAAILQSLSTSGEILAQEPVPQSLRVHERCDTPVEYALTRQWFVRTLEFKQDLLAAGAHIRWHPEHMHARYRDWVENLGWDWCISRQRSFGVSFPVWYCQDCERVILAAEGQLPVDPLEDLPPAPCECGSTRFRPELDVMDTWATSSLTPQIVGRWWESRASSEASLYHQVYPFGLRPQAHEIIRSWAFYTILKNLHHFETLPWERIAISGWGLAPEGSVKISKSRGGGPSSPQEMIDKYSADAVRYWAASTGYGKDTRISEEMIQTGMRLVTKLWNVALFAERFLDADHSHVPEAHWRSYSPADRWLLSKTQKLIVTVTDQFEKYDYAAAKNQVETFFWNILTDNYLEMAKQRLYDAENGSRAAAIATLSQVLLTTLKLLAPFLPYVTEEIYLALFRDNDGAPSIHTSAWPREDKDLIDPEAESLGELLVEIATAVRRYKSEQGLSLATELHCLQVATGEPALARGMEAARADLLSVTRARELSVRADLASGLDTIYATAEVSVAIQRALSDAA